MQGSFGKSEEIRKRLSSLFNGMMKALFNEKGSQFRIDILAEQPAQDFINAHADALNSGFQQVPMSDSMRQRLQRSNYIFSGMKTFHELNEAFPSLIDENGNRKPFEQFLNDVQRIDRTYNQNYLRAEYNFVHASATMAAKWEEFMQDGDRYNLQYRTAHDDRVRPEHAALDRVTLPITDPFWESYYPPNGWNCRCTVVQVRKSKYPETPHDQAMALGEEATGKDTKGIFHFNPGIEQKTVPDYNPYTIKRCRDCDIAKGNGADSPLSLSRPFIPENELCQACRLLHQIRQEEQQRPLTSQERRQTARSADAWAKKHLEEVVLEDGNVSKRLYITNNETGDRLILNRDFFSETFAKNNRRRNFRLAETMKYATQIEEWMPNATFIEMENGIDHPEPFKVYHATHNGVNLECKVMVRQTGLYLYTMRIRKEN